MIQCLILVFVILAFLYALHRYFAGAKCQITRNMKDKYVFITGANTGIGKTTALELAKLGANLILACRDQRKAKEVQKELEKQGSNPIMLQLDMNDLRSVEKCVEDFQSSSVPHIDVLINNAGIMATIERNLTAQGFEQQFGVNHVAHFYLTSLLKPYLLKSQEPRVINVSSYGHTFSKLNFDDMECNNYAKSSLWAWYYTYLAYGNSKLANILHAMEIPSRYGEKITAVSLHPGAVRTELLRNQLQNKFIRIWLKLWHLVFLFFTRSVLEGAQTSLYCALEETQKLKQGGYYFNCKLIQPQKTSKQLAQRLWDYTESEIKSRMKNQ